MQRRAVSRQGVPCNARAARGWIERARHDQQARGQPAVSEGRAIGFEFQNVFHGLGQSGLHI
eukprot:5197329-Lingulodinium_polyedra.AAC.1